MPVKSKKALIVGLVMILLGCVAGSLGYVVDFALLVFFGIAAVGLSFIESW